MCVGMCGVCVECDVCGCVCVVCVGGCVRACGVFVSVCLGVWKCVSV